MKMTKAHQAKFAQQPFTMQQLTAFCGTKQLAKQLGVDMGDAISEAQRAVKRGECEDSVFDLMFWNGTLVLDTDEQFDIGLDAEGMYDFAEALGYCEVLDADIVLGEVAIPKRHGYEDRKFIAVRYLWKEDEFALSVWWLGR